MNLKYFKILILNSILQEETELQKKAKIRYSIPLYTIMIFYEKNNAFPSRCLDKIYYGGPLFSD